MILSELPELARVLPLFTGCNLNPQAVVPVRWNARMRITNDVLTRLQMPSDRFAAVTTLTDLRRVVGPTVSPTELQIMGQALMQFSDVFGTREEPAGWRV